MGAGLVKKIFLLTLVIAYMTEGTAPSSLWDSVFRSSRHKRLVNHFSNEILQDIPSSISCVDNPREAPLCPIWKRYGFCKYRYYLRQYCAKTCDICSPPAPPVPVLPPCAKTAFGCCWDNRTAAKGPVDDLIASQCTPCMNRQSKKFCTDWSDKCNSPIIGQGDVMRERCPTTCGTPCNYNLNIHKSTCHDDIAYRQSCLEWFTEGKCITDSEIMRVLCPASCGFCHKVKKLTDYV